MSSQSAPTVSPSQVTAAGIASAGAAAVTSFAGIAGTLIGAALTAMIITGGSAILRAYLESVGGKVREVPRKLQARTNHRETTGQAGSYTVYGRPDLRNNSVGRLRAAVDWFSRLSPTSRRPVLVKGILAGVIAFTIGMGVVTVAEAGVLRNTLSCGLWSHCSAGAAPGIGGGTAGATPEIGGGGAATSTFGRVFEAGGGSPGGGFPGGGPPDDPPAVEQQY